MNKHCPLLACRLTDAGGNRVNPYTPGSIVYTVLPSPDERNTLTAPSEPEPTTLVTEGYVAVFSDEKRVSPPIPFCILNSFHLFLPKGGFFAFQTNRFQCWAAPPQPDIDPEFEQIQLLIRIETIVFAKKAASLQVPQVNSQLQVTGRTCISTNRIYDSARIINGCSLIYRHAALNVELYQYNAISDGKQRIFTNSDELKEYGRRGILSPDEVSYYNVFVNGVMQPKATYILKKGELTFTTQDIPAKGHTVMILYTTWKDITGQIMNVCNWQYNALGDGEKKIYTNRDELKEYGNYGIPPPNEVSLFNLFINGVLQPETNYRVKKGTLKLTTTDAPTIGAPVILECIAIRDPNGPLFRAEASSYNTYSNGGKIYNNQDELEMYGKVGIPNPDEISYQNLYINGVIQPHVNYLVQKGCLLLETENTPTIGAPITLQSVNRVCASTCNKTKMSDSALAQWNKTYSFIKIPL